MSDIGSSARELREKYQALLAENGRLREEIRQLKARLRDESLPASALISQNTQGAETKRGGETRKLLCPSMVNNSSDARGKIGLFLSLKGISGYRVYGGLGATRATLLLSLFTRRRIMFHKAIDVMKYLSNLDLRHA